MSSATHKKPIQHKAKSAIESALIILVKLITLMGRDGFLDVRRPDLVISA